MTPHTVTITLTDRERAALDEIRAILGLRSDEAAIHAGLYKLGLWVEPDIDTTLFRLDRPTRTRLYAKRRNDRV